MRKPSVTWIVERTRRGAKMRTFDEIPLFDDVVSTGTARQSVDDRLCSLQVCCVADLFH